MKKLIILLLVFVCSACDIYWTCDDRGEKELEVELSTGKPKLELEKKTVII
jgi:hypothetical protein